MTHTRFLKSAAVITAFTAIVFAGMMSSSKRVRARDDESSGQTEESRIRRGFAIAPVPLNLQGKNRALVGLGSYIVNAQGACNDCHTCRSYVVGTNPFPAPFGAGVPGHGLINSANYLAGGVPFTAGPPPGVTVISKNITPDATGKP